MAIFGWNGLMGLSLYFASLFAVYGTKNASFRDSAEFATIEKLVPYMDKFFLSLIMTSLSQSGHHDQSLVPVW